MPAEGQIRIGISGWRYKPWRRIFYPAGLPQNRELAYAASIFSTIEINGTFYSLQHPVSFEKWANGTPDDFVFSVKGPRYITHFLRLKNSERPLANFFASGLLALGNKLGPILWQLPPNFKFDSPRLEEFFRALPRTTKTAAALARHHDKWLRKRAYTKCEEDRRLRHAIEIRHTSFLTPDFVRLLRKYNVALVCADTVEWPRVMDLTSDFVYCRLHGSQELYVSGYNKRSLDDWARRVKAWVRGKEPGDAERIVPSGGRKLAGRDVFVYFDNDAKVRAPFDAQSLMKSLTSGEETKMIRAASAKR